MKQKEPIECSDRELLIRIDERTKHLPTVVHTVNRHDRELLVAKVLFVVMMIAIGAKYQWVAEALARVLGS